MSDAEIGIAELEDLRREGDYDVPRNQYGARKQGVAIPWTRGSSSNWCRKSLYREETFT